MMHHKCDGCGKPPSIVGKLFRAGEITRQNVIYLCKECRVSTRNPFLANTLRR